MLLALTMAETRSCRLSAVLLTCHVDSVASAKVILRNGGVPRDEVVSAVDGRPISRYWISRRTQ
jgi:predicted acetyltransferase